MSTRKPPTPLTPKYPRVFESFDDNEWGLASNATRFREPEAFNQRVRVRRFRTTVELVEEPREVIAERIRKLWRENSNHHDREALMAAAAEYGVKLEPGEWGADANKEDHR